ncbi:MAG: polymer-forming cytoskeletal protein [Candidatus Omnitrophica bacterium]|nr:polymer-forming cytoskeletal protein [Candidatus Omnitrophota bacterium]
MADYIFTEDDIESASSETLEDEPNQIRSFAAPDVIMEGELTLKHGIEIGGAFKGAIHSHSTVKVLPLGRLEGKVETYNLTVDGRANLSLVARKKLEINKGGRFIGTLDVQPELIVLSEHASFGETEESARAFEKEFPRE